MTVQKYHIKLNEVEEKKYNSTKALNENMKKPLSKVHFVINDVTLKILFLACNHQKASINMESK